MRPRKRYVAFEVEEGKLDVHRVVASICRELGVEPAEIKVVLYEAASGRGLLLCGHHLAGEVKRILLQGRIPVRLLGVSGTIRAAKRKFLAPPAARERPVGSRR
jgi:RNase P/RNase MRP subunit POP5